MSTIEFIDHLTTIMFDIVMPLLVAWLAYKVRGRFPMEEKEHVVPDSTVPKAKNPQH